MTSRAGIVAAFACAAVVAPAQATGAEPRVPGEVIVQFERGTSGDEREGAREGAGTEPAEPLGSPGLQLVEVTDDDSVARTIRELEADPAVRFAEPNTIDQLSAVPNDPEFGQLWGLHNTGQAVNVTPPVAGTSDADIDAPEAWDIETGEPDTVVAVMDSGIDPTHPDLAGNLWQNPGEVAGNGVDDDGNGFVDDLRGFDFVAEDANPLDAVGHGTHVSGTIAGAGNNGLGMTGVAQRAQIMSLRVCDVSGCDLADQIQAINYAAANGARVLNGSLGGFSNDESQARRAAIFSHSEVLHVFAAGNDSANADGDAGECSDGGSDPDPCRAYPCAHAPQGVEVDNVVCVAATTQSDNLAGFSNTGATSVDLAAPGSNIKSANAETTHLNNDFSAASQFTNQWNPDSGFNWQHTFEAPIPSGGITDSPGAGPALYDNGTTYRTISDSLFVDPVSERGCFIRFTRSIALAADGDRFRVALLHTDPAADPQYSFSSASNSALDDRTLDFAPTTAGGAFRIRLRLDTDPVGQANGVHISDISLECAETPGPHNYDFKNGTSMASPHVAGAAALLISRNPAASTTGIRDKLLQTVDPRGALSGNTTTGGRLNIGTAMGRMPADTAITSGPGEGEEIGTPNATFGVSSGDPAATFQCSVDGGTFAACGSGTSATVGPLAPGAHSVAIRSVDPRGNADTTPATRSFSVESDAPETGIRKGPKKRTDARKATFKFAADEPGSTFECKIDRKPFRPCTSPRRLKKVKPGKHKFLVRSIDAVGNVDATPARKRWRVER